MAFIASVADQMASRRDGAATRGLMRMLLDVFAEARMRRAEREIRRFDHLDDVSWTSDASANPSNGNFGCLD
jgi:hypothetical protein